MSGLTPESAWAYLDRKSGVLGCPDITNESGDNCADQCTECRAAPGMPHAIGCAVFEERLTYHPDPTRLSSMHVDSPNRLSTVRDDNPCDSTAQITEYVSNEVQSHATVTAPETTSPADSSHENATFPQGENSVNVKVEPCSECGSVTYPYDEYRDPEDGMTDIEAADALDAAIWADEKEEFNVPLGVQEWLFEALIETEVDHLHEIIDDHHDEIVEMARRRHREGHRSYGSEAYAWGAAERFGNVLEELADAAVYCTSGPIE